MSGLPVDWDAVRIPPPEKCFVCGWTAVRNDVCQHCGAEAVADAPEPVEDANDE